MADIADQLTARVRAARADRTPLRIQGGNSKGGRLGRAVEGQTLDLTGHSGIVTYQPGELVLTARAGTPLAEIEAALAAHGQALSFEPPHYGPAATLGGTLACNLSGPARPWGGSFRDMVLGVRLINGRGEHLRFGGQVMKNVAGYDLSRLQAGAMGTLGVITEISLKVLPRPRATLSLALPLDEAEAIRRMTGLGATARPLSGAAWAGGVLHLRLAGEAEAVAAARADLPAAQEEDPAFWADLREQRLAFFDEGGPLWRLSVAATAPPLEPDAATVIDWGGALRWYRGGDARRWFDLAARAGGHALEFGGDGRRQPLAPALQILHRRLKTAFDPAEIFNPGILYGWM